MDTGGGIDAYEDDDGYYNVFLPPGPETSIGCGHCGKAETIAPLTSSDSDGAPTSSSSAAAHVEAKEGQQPSPSSLVRQVGAVKLDADPAAQDGGQVGPVKLDADPAAQDGGAVAADAAASGSSSEQGAHGAAADVEAEEDDETTDEDEDDDEYQEHYDRAERGRARCVKRSSGRRGRTKKASTIGRPRGDVRRSQIADDH